MGYSQAWLAIRGKSPDTVLQTLGLKATGQYEEFAESPIVGTMLPSGWFLVVANRSGYESQLSHEPTIATVSLNCEVISGDVEEHVMASSLCGWKNGQKTWSVFHIGERNTEHLEFQGDMPSAFYAIRDRLLNEQQKAGGRKAGADYVFDIPVELCKSLIGYRYSQDIAGAEKNPFEALLETRSDAENKKPSLWSRLFGSARRG